ncbi:ABC transporter permease [Longispora albida]|uniref:ABC transporter permease n=1 Tax=Longispora albida TaxID=203523 RepID=UPI00037C8C34|nr:ABC transporter permease [Longispora albida]
MADVIVSEWLKLRTVRSTYWVLAALVAFFAGGSVIAYLMTADYDGSPPAMQVLFAAADPGVVVVPLAQFCLAVLGALAVTSEYGTGTIRPSLTAVPGRARLLLGKVLVVGGLGLAAGQLVTFASLAAGELITGDRPAPISAWTEWSDGVPSAIAGGLSIMVAGIAALGLGFVIRSTAGALVTMTLLLFVLPSVAFFLPAPWGARVSAVMLPNLPGQLAGAYPDAVLSPAGAGVALAAYGIAAIGAGWWALSRRDA